MKKNQNPDPAVKGFPRSVIVGLIKVLEETAENFITEEGWKPSGEEHHEVLGMRRLMEEYGPSVMLLLSLVDIDEDEPAELVTRHLAAFKDFLAKVSIFLNTLSPSTPSE